MTKPKEIKEALKDIQDPELMIDIVSLGFIYDVKMKDGKVDITMTLTFPGCPYGPTLVEQIRDRILKFDDVKKVEVEVTFDPPWQPPEGLRAMYGV